MPATTVAEIARLCEGVARGDLERIIAGAAPLETAGTADLSFVSNAKARTTAVQSRAGCLIVDPLFEADGTWALVAVPDPRRAFARVLRLLYPQPAPSPGIHPTAVIDASARLAADVSVGAYAMVGADSEIGSGSCIADHVHVGSRVRIGCDAILNAHVTIYDGAVIGDRVILHAGCVIGADGFGFTLDGDHYEKFPQVGSVCIEDDVEIGANCCIDRAALGITRIGEGTKLDNLIHIAHNCSVGKHVVIAAQTGFAGGVIVGDYAVIGGQVGVGEKATIASKAVVGSGAGILSLQRVEAGEPVWGTPARPLKKHLKGLANVGKIDSLKEAVRNITHRLDQLEK